MKDLLTKILKEHDTTQDTDLKSDVQFIVDRVYSHIVNNLGPSKYVDQPPTVELWKDIYARLSDIEGMEGEESATSEAEYETHSNTIYVYYPNMKNEEDVIKSLLHEYTHSLQDPETRKGHRELGYENDPDEIAASKAEEKWRDYLVYLKENLNEQKESNASPFMSPALIKLIRYVLTLKAPTAPDRFIKEVDDVTSDWVHKENIYILYLVLMYNLDGTQGKAEREVPVSRLLGMLNNLPLEDYVLPPALFNYQVVYKSEYEQYDDEEECEEQSEGYATGERSGDECTCAYHETFTVEKFDSAAGENYKQEMECDEMSDKELQKHGIDDLDDCPCVEWETKYVTLYYYSNISESIWSSKPYDYGNTDGPYSIDEFHTNLNSDGVRFGDAYEETADREEPETWDYFSDSEGGEMVEWDVDEYGYDDILRVMQQISEEVNNPSFRRADLNEQDEQTNLFPMGEWEFPVGWEKDDDYISEVKHNVPENLFKKIFDMWDKNGIDFSIFKLIGVRPDTVTNTYVLKRYIQNTTKPIPVSYTFDCNDLKELFDRNNNDYDLSYIPAYLCGDDSFWDHEDWYNYEWDDYMTDAINESNWKTISEIFGGVSQSDAEDILNKSSSSEEVDELIEKYEEEIDEIQNYIIWAYNDEHEYAIKNEMAKDIEDKIVDHFNGEGHLHTDNEGSKSWTIEGDLRDYVNDQWDNTDTFEYHPDHTSQPLEDMMLDYTMGSNLPYAIFSALIEEEYIFWEYCEGKQGECLQPETKWFDGYWHPDVDINESLSDRLGELTYEPTVTTPEGEIKPLHEAQEGEKDMTKDKNQVRPTDDTPFTPLDVKILNRLVTMFERAVLNNIWKEDESMLPDSVVSKYEGIMKLYGETSNKEFSFARSTRFAKWADDNWDEAERMNEISKGDDFDPYVTYNLDFGTVTNPVKDWPHEYEVEATESYWAKEYRYGSTIIPAYNEENAEHRADTSWWEWDVDMEYGDQGDTDEHELEVDTVQYLNTISEGETKQLHEDGDGETYGDDFDDEHGYVESADNFTPAEVRILNLIVKRFSLEELTTIATRDDTQYPNDIYTKWKDVLKLFGETALDEGDSYGKSTRYAKWIIDNIQDAGLPGDDNTIDFGRVKYPTKAWPSVYEVEATEDGWEQVYKTGYIDIVGFDKEDAEERAGEAWWEYEPDMETTDWGDYDVGDFEISNISHNKVLKEESISPIDTKEHSPDLEIGDRIMAWELSPDPSPPGGYSSYPDGAVKIPRTLIGTIIDSLDDDEIDLESFRGGIKYVVRDDSSGEEYGLYRGADGYSEPYLDRDKWVKLPPTTLKEIKHNLHYYMKLSENICPFIVKEVKGSKSITPNQLNEYIKTYKENCDVDNRFLIIDKENLIDRLEYEGIRTIQEHGPIPGGDEEEDTGTNFPEWMTKFLVTAFFFHPGGWGVAPKRFKIYMKPNGQVVKTDTTASMNLSEIPEEFRIGKVVTFGDLLNFENNSKFDLRMKGRIRESFINPHKKILMEIVGKKIEMTPQKHYFLNNLLKESMVDNVEDLLRLAKETRKGWMAGPGRKKVFEFLNNLRESGLVNMYQSPDFLWSGSRWLNKYIDLHHPEYLEPIDEYEDNDGEIRQKEIIRYLLDNADSVRDVIISNILAKAEEQGVTDINTQSRMMRPAAIDMFKLWGQYVA